MLVIRDTLGYRELLRVCCAMIGRPNARTEAYFLGRVDRFIECAEFELRESDVMWTLGWDSGEKV